MGKILNPVENLYFRQDTKYKPMAMVCAEHDCGMPPIGFQTYCMMHTKRVKYEGYSAMCYLRERLGERWPEFVHFVKTSVEKSVQSGNTFNQDGVSIEMQYMVDILRKKFDITVEHDIQKILHKAFGSKSENHVRRIEIEPIMNVKNHKSLRGTYDRVLYEPDEKFDAEFEDMAGYIGNKFRRKLDLMNKKLIKVDDPEFLVDLFRKKNKILKVMQTIRTIDREKNGFVTNQELEDILKLQYKHALMEYDIKPIFKMFASQQNRLLINYKHFKHFILVKLGLIEDDDEQSTKDDQVGSFAKSPGIAAK